jgi:hypothetical protein
VIAVVPRTGPTDFFFQDTPSPLGFYPERKAASAEMGSHLGSRFLVQLSDTIVSPFCRRRSALPLPQVVHRTNSLASRHSR